MAIIELWRADTFHKMSLQSQSVQHHVFQSLPVGDTLVVLGEHETELIGRLQEIKLLLNNPIG